jgi:hypothetical protein
MKTENERIDSEERKRKTERKLTTGGRTTLTKKHWTRKWKMMRPVDGDDNGPDSSDEGANTSEGVCDKNTHGRDHQTRHLKNLVYTSNSFVDIHDKEQNVVQGNLQEHQKTEFLSLKVTQVSMFKGLYVSDLVYVRIVY